MSEETRYDRRLDLDLEKRIREVCTHEILYKKQAVGVECLRCNQPFILTTDYEFIGRATPYCGIDGTIRNINLYRKIR